MIINTGKPTVKVYSGVIGTIPNYYSWATFMNSGLSAGTIDFGDGNILPLGAGEAITLPMAGKMYEQTIIDASATTIKVVYQN